MLLWCWSACVLVTMMAMLLLLPELSPVPMTTPMLPHIALLCLLVVAFGGYRLWYRLGGWLRGAGFIVFVLASTALCAWRVYDIYGQYLAQTPQAPVQVVAHVHIDQLSDSPYDPDHNRPYRQEATLTHITTEGVAKLPQMMTVMLIAYPHKGKAADPKAPLRELQVGDRAVMTLKLSPLTLEQHSIGFDSTRWLMTRHIHANAQVVSVDQMMGADGVLMERQRERYRQAFIKQHNANQDQAAAVALSLLTGDRALIDQPTKALYQAAGISHLLAISGTHVLFLAILCAGMVCAFLNRYYPKGYYYLPRWQLRFWVMVAVGVCYAWFTGFEVPAVRTVLLLFLMGMARYLLLEVSPMRLLAVAAVVMAYIDPYVLWQAGFWLSFVAVALLMAYENQHKAEDIKTQLGRLLSLQAYIFLTMLPLTLLLFGKVSLWGLLVNVVAVGLFGWVIVPLNLLGGLLYEVSPMLGGWAWGMAIALLGGVHAVLTTFIERFGAGYIGAQMSVAVVILSFLALVAWRWVVVPTRFAVLPLVVLAMFYGLPKPQNNHTRLTLLATTQTAIGAVLLQSDGHAYLILSHMPSRYPSNDEVLADELWLQLKQTGVTRLNGTIIQNDHQTLWTLADTLAQRLPVHALYAPSTKNSPSARPCIASQTLTMGAVTGEMVTGWQVGDTLMTTCNLSLHSHLPWQIAGDVVGVDGKPVAATLPAGDVLLDATEDDKLWQLYRLLCPEPTAPALVLTHSQSALDDQTLTSLAAPAVLFINHLKNANERKRATDRLLMLSPE